MLAQRRGGTLADSLLAVSPSLRPGVQALGFEALRHWGQAQVLRGLLARRAPPPAVDALLCVTLALMADEATDRYEPHTLVNQAVEAVRRDPAARAQAAFVNACLRRFVRERASLTAASLCHELARWNHPAWWVARLRTDWPGDWQRVLQVNNTHAPLALRVNRHRIPRDAYLALLQQAGIAATPFAEHGLRLHQPQAVPSLPGYAQGLFSVQDAAAQRAAPLLLQGLDLQAPLRILDACAAPGGKTAHLLEQLPAGSTAQVTALDVDAQRCQRMAGNLQRLGLAAHVQCADAGQPAAWWDGQGFDAVLLDAPCTASGIVRRHPDVRWLRRDSDVEQLAAQAQNLLAALWPLVKPGGRLLFATCSVFKAEGEAPISAFLARNTNARLCPSPGHLMPQTAPSGELFPDNPGCDQDGFFYALLEKR